MRPGLQLMQAIGFALVIIVWTFICTIAFAFTTNYWYLLADFGLPAGYVLVLRRQYHYGWGRTIAIGLLAFSFLIFLVSINIYEQTKLFVEKGKPHTYDLGKGSYLLVK